MSKEDYDINLSKYRNHKRSIPWGLIRKIIFAAILVALIWYMNDSLKEKKQPQENLPTEVELDL